MARLTRRKFLSALTAGTVICLEYPKLAPGETRYKRANTDWLAKCRFGIGIHWTAQTVRRSGSPKPSQKAIGDFDLDTFIAAVEHGGADYILFTEGPPL